MTIGCDVCGPDTLVVAAVRYRDADLLTSRKHLSIGPHPTKLVHNGFSDEAGSSHVQFQINSDVSSDTLCKLDS